VYSADLKYINNSDGGVIGPISGDDYLVHVNFLDVDELTAIQFVQSDGSVVTLKADKKAYLIGKRNLLSYGQNNERLHFDRYPPQVSKSPNAEFQFYLDPPSNVETLCSLDQAELASCMQNEPIVFTNLANGIHDFVVVVNDGSENPKSYKYSWAIYSNTDGYYPDLCAKAASDQSMVSFEYTADFSSTNSVCMWSKGDNLDQKNGYMQAFVDQNISIKLNEDFHLCDASVATTSSTNAGSFRYDDNFYLNLNGKVLATNKVSVLNMISNEGLSYDWNMLKGQKDVNRTKADELYCRGGVVGQNCKIPLTDRDGTFSLDFSEYAISPILSRGFDKSLNFSMVVIGDNDNSDCQHSGMRLKVKVKGVNRK
jgi:hypothetical protein